MEKFPINLKFLGGTNEVGRSAIAVKTSKVQVLLDYGVLMDREPGFPMHVPPKEVDAIIATHCHLDHCGAIPMFHIRGHTPVYGSPLTFELAELLISDFIHLSSYYLPYEFLDLQSMMQCSVGLAYRKPVKIGDLELELLNSGHIPGGAQALLRSAGEHIVYTSDFNTEKTRLLSGADLEYGDLDCLIIESTYAEEDHTADRTEIERSFMTRVTEVVERGGTVLVPAFGVGRSQEITCVLAAHHFEYPVTIDGMTVKTNEILMRYQEYLQDPRLFTDANRMTNWVHGWKERRKAAGTPGVIVAPAGMLKGGTAVFYMQKLAKKKDNAIFLVSYQIPGTPGRELLEKRMFIINGAARKVEAEMERFDFSSHCGRQELCETVKNVKGTPTVFVVHGAEGNCQNFAGWIEQEVGLKAIAPKAGEVFKI